MGKAKGKIEVIGDGWDMEDEEKYLIRKISLLDKEKDTKVWPGYWIWGYAHHQIEGWKFKIENDLKPEVGKSLYFYSYRMTERDLVTSTVQATHKHEGGEGWENVEWPEDFPVKDIKQQMPIMKDDVVFITNNSVYWAQKHKNHCFISERDKIYRKHSEGDILGTSNS